MGAYARRRPGALLHKALRTQAQFLAPVVGATADEHVFLPRVGEFFAHVSSQQVQGVRNLRELRTLAQIIDSIILGDLAFAADTAIQRYKAVELAAETGIWALAEEVELLPPSGASSLAPAERRNAVTRASRSSRNATALQRIRSGQRPGGQLQPQQQQHPQQHQRRR